MSESITEVGRGQAGSSGRYSHHGQGPDARGLGPSPLTSPTRMPTVAASEAEAVTLAEEAGTEALGETGGTGVATAETRPPGAAPGNSTTRI